jgi:hypothetical protein
MKPGPGTMSCCSADPARLSCYPRPVILGEGQQSKIDELAKRTQPMLSNWRPRKNGDLEQIYIMSDAKLRLSDVTLCAADSMLVDFTARALATSIKQVEFGDAILFSDQPRDGPFRFVQITPLNSIEAYSIFCLRHMAPLIKTPYVLVIQWDGFVINSDAWANAFRKYDYIGAAWHGLFPPDRMVGNGGFSLRSGRLLRAVQRLPFTTAPEDRTICHRYRETLERESGVRFAPVKIADRFAYEYKELDPSAPPFGFHGVYHLWRHMDEATLNELAERIDILKMDPARIIRFLLNCAAGNREEAAQRLYRRIRARVSTANVAKIVAGMFPATQAEANLQLLEKLLVNSSG